MKTPQNTSHCPRSTPWGHADHVKQIADGIWDTSAPGHGGYYVAPHRMVEMPPSLASISPWAGANWYEEDCDWAIVAAAFPQHFDARSRFYAYSTLKGLSYAKSAFEAFMATEAGQQFKHHHDVFHAEHAKHFTISIMGTDGGDWQITAHSVNGEQRADWSQPDYPEYESPFAIEEVTAAGHKVIVQIMAELAAA